jgi:dipeptidyl aminopeptidase/acylaminoacyl peptidase
MPSLAQLLRIPRVDAGFDISPDDSKIAFAWNKTGEWQIYEATLPSPSGRRAGDEGEPTPITSGTGAKFNPRYSPDGARLAYAFDADGSESYHLIVYDFATRTHTDLTPDLTLQPNFCWSPDGHQLAFLSDANGHFCTYIMPSTGGEAQLVLDTGHPAWQVEWSPNGKHLAVCCEMHGQDYGIFVVGVETKEVTPICHPERQRRVSNPGKEILRRSTAQNDIPLNAHAPQWSPDGQELVFHADLNRWFDIGIYDLEAKDVAWLTGNIEGDSQTPIIIARNIEGYLTHQLAYTQSKGAVNWVETLRLRSAPLSANKYQIGKGIHNGIRLTPDWKRMVTTFSSPSQPPDLWLMDVESGEAIQLTHSMPDRISQDEFVMPEEIVYPGMDGVEVPALLFRPQKIPAPAVVMIHGGPNWHYSMEWNPAMAYFASRGYVVLAPNYRGSTGYGRAWQYAARFDLGGVDTRDVAAGAQYLIRAGLAIENKIAVTGRSHGGYLTMTCLTQFPELWCAGSAVVPFTNWFKTHANSRADVQHWDIENMGDPQENYERWHDASPFFFLDRLTAPVQLICGGIDPRCPAADSVETRDKLVELGKEVELLLYEDEGHVFLKQENVLDAEVRRVEFIVKNIDR